MENLYHKIPPTNLLLNYSSALIQKQKPLVITDIMRTCLMDGVQQASTKFVKISMVYGKGKKNHL